MDLASTNTNVNASNPNNDILSSPDSSASNSEWTPPKKAGIQLHTPKLGKYYNMNHKSRGIALIFNHNNWKKKAVMGGKRTPYPPREGSNKDAENLQICLCWLGFKKEDVTIHNNLTLEKINKLLAKVSKMDHTHNDCLFICVMTHGENGKLADSEGTCYHLDKLWNHFTPDKCPSLAGKPKLFLVQACRGNNTNGTFVDIRMDNNSLACFSYTIPLMADFLIAFSTTEDSVSWKCPQNGSWFIQSFCQMLCKYPKEDFLSLMTIVSLQVAVSFTACLCELTCSAIDIHQCPKRIQQAPQFLSTLMRKVQFVPIDNAIPFRCDDSTQGNFETFPLEYSPMPVTKYAECYNMKHKNRGVAVIFYCHKWSSKNWEDLAGYIVDKENLAAHLKMLGFDVRGPYGNKNIFEMRDILQQVAEEDHSQNDALLVAVMTHGTQGDLIDSEGVAFTKELLWHPFRAKSCPTLNGKPKILLIQACRGNRDDPGTPLPRPCVEPDTGSLTYSLPPDADFLIVFSSVEDYTSLVMSTSGSSFVQSVCHALSKCVHTDTSAKPKDLLSVLTEASMNVGVATVCKCPDKCCKQTRDECKKKVKQMPQIVSTLLRKIIFDKKTDL